MRYIWETNKDRRVMHIMKFTKSGEHTDEAICGINHNFNRSINAPFELGRKVCKKCLKKLNN